MTPGSEPFHQWLFANKTGFVWTENDKLCKRLAQHHLNIVPIKCASRHDTPKSETTWGRPCTSHPCLAHPAFNTISPCKATSFTKMSLILYPCSISPKYHPYMFPSCPFGLLLPTNFKPWRQFTLACAMVKNTVEIGSYRLQGHCEVTWGRQEGLPPQWSLLVCNSISNKHGGFIGKSSINGKNSRKRSENKGTHTHTLWMEVYGSENHRTDGNYKWIHHIPRPQTWLGNRWTQWFIMEIICNQQIIFIRDFPDHLWFPVFYWQICCGSLKTASNILPG